MKFLSSTLIFASFLGATFAQRVIIGYPTQSTTVSRGSNLTVEVDRPNSLSPSKEVGIAIGLNSCQSARCPPSDEVLGTVLYTGGYDPQYRTGAPASKPPHQNFTVTIPESTPAGQAVLTVFHASLIGASNGPFTETLNITVNIV